MVGIGGIGMSSIAEVLVRDGFTISGSDMNLSEVTARLETMGVRIFQGHQAANLGDAEVLVYSSAVHPDNPELLEARRRNIPSIRRAEMLAELMRMKFGIGIAGTHGKTTTTTMTGAILIRGGLDPTVIVGGISPLFGSNARIGASEFLVVEADEFDRTFLKLNPTIAVVTNIELEHLDCYRDMDDLAEAFTQFVNAAPFYGTVIMCIDEPGVQRIMPAVERPILTYGLTAQADIQARNIRFNGIQSRFDIYSHGNMLGEAELSVPGIHNVKNSLAAAASALELDIPFDKITAGLKDFTGVKRRFQFIGEFNEILVFDDYAHHHSEVKATLEAAKSAYNRRIIAIFQPHLYSRTRDFYRDFGSAFHQAEILIVAPIYPAREEPIPGISGEMIVQAAREAGHREAYYIEDRTRIADFTRKLAQKGDIIITMGAGDIWKTGRELVEKN